MPKLDFPDAAVPADLPAEIRLQIVASTAAPPGGEGWLHEIKHDGHRLIAVVDGHGRLTLISRNGYDRTPLFRAPFDGIVEAGRALVLDGEIAVPDERGVTHIDGLNDVIARRQPECLAYYAFDLLHVDGQDLRRCAIEERKALLRHMLDEVACERIVYVDHVVGRGAELFDRVREIGAEGIVSKRVGSLYRGCESRDWLKTKCHETGRFVVTGFQELGEGRLEAIHIAEERDGVLHPAGQVRFGFAGKGLWAGLDALRCGPASKGVVPIRLPLKAEFKFFGRFKGGSIRDGVILSIGPAAEPALPTRAAVLWCCDSDDAVRAYDGIEAPVKTRLP